MATTIFIVVICIAIVIQLYTGATIMNRRGTPDKPGGVDVIRRDEYPAAFWGAIGFQIVLIILSLLATRHVIR